MPRFHLTELLSDHSRYVVETYAIIQYNVTAIIEITLWDVYHVPGTIVLSIYILDNI